MAAGRHGTHQPRICSWTVTGGAYPLLAFPPLRKAIYIPERVYYIRNPKSGQAKIFQWQIRVLGYGINKTHHIVRYCLWELNSLATGYNLEQAKEIILVLIDVL